MNGQSELKYYVISDFSQKYEDINKKIIFITKLYFNTMKNNSYLLSQIEIKLNEYNVKGEVKIKQLLERQQSLIKELIKIINNIIFESRNSQISKKLEEQLQLDCFPLKQKNIITTTNNCHIFSQPHYILDKPKHLKKNVKEKRINLNENLKSISTNETIKNNKTKSVDDKNVKKIIKQKKAKKVVALNVIAPKNGNEFNGALSFLNIKSSNQNNKKVLFGKFVNKDKSKKKTKPLKQKILKSMSSSEISYKPKVIINKNNLYLKTSNIGNNNNPSFINNNNNYTIDEEKNDNNITLINERQNSIGNSQIIDNYGMLPHILTKRKKRIKYRGGKVLLTDNNINNNKNIMRVKSAKEIPVKTELYITTNTSFYNFNQNNNNNFTPFEKNGNLSYKKRSKSSLSLLTSDNDFKEKFKSNKKIDTNDIYSVPYINNGRRITPSRFTKEVLNNSYKILNKYAQKRIKNS